MCYREVYELDISEYVGMYKDCIVMLECIVNRLVLLWHWFLVGCCWN